MYLVSRRPPLCLPALLCVAMLPAGPALSARAPADAAPPPRLALVDAGAAPHNKLRITTGKPVEGLWEATVVTRARRSDKRGKPVVQQLPQMTAMGRISARQPQPGGPIEVKASVQDVWLDRAQAKGPLADGLAARSAALAGKRIDSIQSPLGETLRTRIHGSATDLDNDLLARVLSNRHDFRVMLPMAAIGARWELEEVRLRDGIRYRVRTRYQLDALDGRRATLSVKILQSAGEQPLRGRTLPPGASAHLRSASGQGQGVVLIHLDHPVPERISGTMQQRMQVDIRHGDKVDTSTWQQSVKLQFARP